MSEHVRTLESQAVIRHIAGTLSTFPPFSGEHPSWCIPIAENIYDAYIAQLERERDEQAAKLVQTKEWLTFWKNCTQHDGDLIRQLSEERDEDRAAILEADRIYSNSKYAKEMIDALLDWRTKHATTIARASRAPEEGTKE